MSSQTLQPIETKYRGYRFRSRLEARWAVFFDALDLDFEYETEGFDLGKPGYFLPDFWLPSLKAWAEIKPSRDLNKSNTFFRCATLSEHAQTYVLLLEGTPGYDLAAKSPLYSMTVFGGRLWNMWGNENSEDWFHGLEMNPLFEFESLRNFLLLRIKEDRWLHQDDISPLAINPLDESARRKTLVELDALYQTRRYGEPMINHGMRFAKATWQFSRTAYVNLIVNQDADLPPAFRDTIPSELQRAFDLAQSARFEHGESP